MIQKLKNKKIAILGASYLQKPIIEKAIALNIEVHCFAWEEGAVCKDFVDYFYPISVLDKEAILQVCKKVKIDGIVSIASDIVVPVWAYVASEMNLVSNSLDVATVCSNKFLMRNKLLSNAINSPRFVSINKENIGFLSEKIAELSFPVIVKPVDRSGSRGVTKIMNESDVLEAVESAMSVSLIGESIIEEFVIGKEYSVESISFNECHSVLAITKKVTTGAPYFVETEHHQPANISENLKSEITYFTQEALKALGVKYGASHTELIITEDNQIYIVEIGARMGGDFIGSHLVELSTGVDYLKQVIYCALDIPFELNLEFNNTKSGVYFLTKDNNIEEILNNKDLSCVEIKEGTVDLKKIKNSSERVGYLIYQGK